MEVSVLLRGFVDDAIGALANLFQLLVCIRGGHWARISQGLGSTRERGCCGAEKGGRKGGEGRKRKGEKEKDNGKAASFPSNFQGAATEHVTILSLPRSGSPEQFSFLFLPPAKRHPRSSRTSRSWHSSFPLLPSPLLYNQPTNYPTTHSNTMASEAQAPSTPASTAPIGKDGKPLKPCCACPETKKTRDQCVFNLGEENCLDMIKAHQQCLRDLGFKI